MSKGVLQVNALDSAISIHQNPTSHIIISLFCVCFYSNYLASLARFYSHWLDTTVTFVWFVVGGFVYAVKWLETMIGKLLVEVEIFAVYFTDTTQLSVYQAFTQAPFYLLTRKASLHWRGIYLGIKGLHCTNAWKIQTVWTPTPCTNKCLCLFESPLRGTRLAIIYSIARFWTIMLLHSDSFVSRNLRPVIIFSLDAFSDSLSEAETRTGWTRSFLPLCFSNRTFLFCSQLHSLKGLSLVSAIGQ